MIDFQDLTKCDVRFIARPESQQSLNKLRKQVSRIGASCLIVGCMATLAVIAYTYITSYSVNSLLGAAGVLLTELLIGLVAGLVMLICRSAQLSKRFNRLVLNDQVLRLNLYQFGFLGYLAQQAGMKTNNELRFLNLLGDNYDQLKGWLEQDANGESPDWRLTFEVSEPSDV